MKEVGQADVDEDKCPELYKHHSVHLIENY